MFPLVKVGSKIVNLDHITYIELDGQGEDSADTKRSEINFINGDTLYFYDEELDSLRKVFTNPEQS